MFKETFFLNNFIEFLVSKTVILDQWNEITFTKSQRENQSITNKQSTLKVNSNECVKESFLKHCILCNEESHTLFKYPPFLSVSIDNRIEILKTHNLCNNYMKNHIATCITTFTAIYAINFIIA